MAIRKIPNTYVRADVPDGQLAVRLVKGDANVTFWGTSGEAQGKFENVCMRLSTREQICFVGKYTSSGIKYHEVDEMPENIARLGKGIVQMIGYLQGNSS